MEKGTVVMRRAATPGDDENGGLGGVCWPECDHGVKSLSFRFDSLFSERLPVKRCEPRDGFGLTQPTQHGLELLAVDHGYDLDDLLF